jgi:predicted transport protein
MIQKQYVTVGEDVIVVKSGSEKYDCIGQISKIGKWASGDMKISVSFEGNVFAFRQEDLVLA